MPNSGTAEADFSARWLRTETILLVIALSLLLWIAGDVLLLIFAAILLAVGLDGMSSFAARHTPLSRGWALMAVLVLVLLFLGLIGVLVVPQFMEQFDRLWSQLVEFIEEQLEWLGRYGWAEQMLGEAEDGGVTEAAGTMVEHVADATMMLFGIFSSLIILLVIALFLAADPALYRNGLLKLIPGTWRDRVDATLAATGYALRWWFLGQLASMALLGVTVSLGLFLIGVELWLGLGVLTALLTFIPFIGPLIAAVPILIVGFGHGLQIGMIVLVFYFIVQNIEGNVLVPMIQHRAVHLAPALLIAMQVLLGVLFGAMGLILAAPLTVVGMVAVNKLYIEATLGEEPGPA